MQEHKKSLTGSNQGRIHLAQHAIAQSLTRRSWKSHKQSIKAAALPITASHNQQLVFQKRVNSGSTTAEAAFKKLSNSFLKPSIIMVIATSSGNELHKLIV